MKINFKGFNLTSCNTPLASIMFRANFKSTIRKVGYAYNDIHKPLTIELPLFDALKLRAKHDELYKKCVRINLKDTYSAEELAIINDYFALSTFVAFILKAPNLFKANSYDRTIEDGKEIVSRNYITFAIKVNEICKFTEMISTLTEIDSNSFHNDIEMSVDILMGEEINKFLSYIKTHSIDDMELRVLKYDPEDKDDCDI